jgi:alkanesulfonate monooxygenase SsuD/methylene tetrahydromethanopterin reductase-like flavin-dependent oxidoreductase (luciferase family)
MKATIAGTPDTVAAKVQQLVDLGIGHLHLRFLGEWAGETRHVCKESAELFAKEVMPRFAETPAARKPALAAAI